MSEPKIGRVLAASLHQSINELMPTRVEFYESWLTAVRIRHGGLGRARFAAAISFLRQEGAAYDAVVDREGALCGRLDNRRPAGRRPGPAAAAPATDPGAGGRAVGGPIDTPAARRRPATSPRAARHRGRHPRGVVVLRRARACRRPVVPLLWRRPRTLPRVLRPVGSSPALPVSGHR